MTEYTIELTEIQVEDITVDIFDDTTGEHVKKIDGCRNTFDAEERALSYVRMTDTQSWYNTEVA